MFIYEEISRLFEAPCKYQEWIKDTLWCERFCGKADKEQCWRHYMSVREREENDKRRVKNRILSGDPDSDNR